MNKLHESAKTLFSNKAVEYICTKNKVEDHAQKLLNKMDRLRADKNWSFDHKNQLVIKYNGLWKQWEKYCDLCHKLFDKYYLCMKRSIVFKGKKRKLYSIKLDNVYVYYVIYKGIKHVVKPLTAKISPMNMELTNKFVYDRFTSKIS